MIVKPSALSSAFFSNNENPNSTATKTLARNPLHQQSASVTKMPISALQALFAKPTPPSNGFYEIPLDDSPVSSKKETPLKETPPSFSLPGRFNSLVNKVLPEKNSPSYQDNPDIKDIDVRITGDDDDYTTVSGSSTNSLNEDLSGKSSPYSGNDSNLEPYFFLGEL